MSADIVQISRTISHALRHHPELYSLELDEEGWTSITSLLEALARHQSRWQDLAREDLVALIENADKKRFEIQGDRIRAVYGHSLPQKIPQTAATPPDFLFHGTSISVVEAIRQEGLKPMSRQYVHLSVDRDTALRVGQRKQGKTIILPIRALNAYQSGISFYYSQDTTWLADFIPPEFIDFGSLLE